MSDYQSASNTLRKFTDSLVLIIMHLISGSPTDIHVVKHFVRMREISRTIQTVCSCSKVIEAHP